MKKVLGTMAAVILLAACGGSETKKTEETAAAPAATASNDLSSNPDYTKGLALVAGSDCLTCHKTSEKNIGPAYKEVAAKYENTEENVTMLATKVIKGGSGVWGAVPMTPHPQISQEDAEAMIKYIFLLKK